MAYREGIMTKIHDFANELTKSFNVSATMVHIGVVQFSSKVAPALCTAFHS